VDGGARLRFAAALAAVLGTTCAPAVAQAAPRVSPPTTVVPSAGLPKRVSVDRSNANLAIVRYRGRLYLVFRTAKWQIADDNGALYVISTRDQRHWRYEGKFTYGRDLREPRFLVYHHRLFLYFALLGSNPAAFEPGGLRVTRLLSPGHWTKPKHILQDDFIAWAVKRHDGRAYMSGYTGGGGTFTPNPPPKHVYWLTSADGVHWHPVDPDKPVVYRGQCGETDMAWRPGGGLVTACQTEEVDKLGWGAKICTAPARNTADWTCRGDPRRLDSPFVFVHRGHVYVIARRQPNFGGNYDLGYSELDPNAQFAAYDGAYASTTKRCSLWSIDPVKRTFAPVMDVPGWGDTCYPEMIREGHGRWLLYNYTTPLDGTDEPWITALTYDPTVIYRSTLSFGPPG
jgi:hypothetical protein